MYASPEVPPWKAMQATMYNTYVADVRIKMSERGAATLQYARLRVGAGKQLNVNVPFIYVHHCSSFLPLSFNMNTTITTQPRRMTSDIHHNHRTRASFQSYHGHQPSYNHYHHHPNNDSNYRRASSPILRQYSPPPTRLSIAERFMTLSNTNEKTENEEQRIPASSSRSRISIAEQFMTIPRSPTAEKTMASDEKVQKDCCCNPSSAVDDQLMTQANTPLNIAAGEFVLQHAMHCFTQS